MKESAFPQTTLWILVDSQKVNSPSIAKAFAFIAPFSVFLSHSGQVSILNFYANPITYRKIILISDTPFFCSRIAIKSCLFTLGFARSNRDCIQMLFSQRFHPMPFLRLRVVMLVWCSVFPPITCITFWFVDFSWSVTQFEHLSFSLFRYCTFTVFPILF